MENGYKRHEDDVHSENISNGAMALADLQFGESPHNTHSFPCSLIRCLGELVGMLDRPVSCIIVIHGSRILGEGDVRTFLLLNVVILITIYLLDTMMQCTM